MRTRSSLGSTGSKSNRTQRASIPLTPLSVDEVRKLPKPHTGFEAFIAPFIALVRANPDDLGASGVDLDAMSKDFADYSALTAPRAAAAQKLAEAAQQLAAIDDTRLLLGSRIWTGELIIYARGRAAARTNVLVKRGIEAFARFMRNARSKKTTAPSAPSKPTTT
jgi:hypothetical protein